MTTADRPTPPTSRLLSWLVGCVIVGWLVVYNLMRIGGSTPSSAAWPSLAAGAAAGGAIFVVGALAARRMAASGRVLRTGHAAIPSPSEMDPAQRDAVRLAWPALGALSLVALTVGAFLAIDWLSDDAVTRAKTTGVLAAWNLLTGLWLGDETLRMRRGEAEGIESTILGCTLTAVLAGVGLSRNLVEPGQVALIVLAGIAGALVSVAVWRLHGARGLPLSAAAIVVVAALSLVLPLTL